MSFESHERIKIDNVKRGIAKLEQLKQEIGRATRTLALERNTLLNEISQTTSFKTEKMRISPDIKEGVMQMRQVMITASTSRTIKNQQISITETENQLACFACNETAIKLSADGRSLLMNSYTFRIPKHSLSLQTPTSSAPCKGCGQHFPCRFVLRNTTRKVNTSIFDTSYFIHIFSCLSFKSLDSIKYCHECKLVFLGRIHLGIHRNEHHPRTLKPSWMTYKTYQNTSRVMKAKNISCPACKMSFLAKFKCNQHKGVTPELKYYIHCIEQCPEYKKLNLIAKCNECDKLFLNKNALGHHITAEHGSNAGAGEPVRSWMTPSLRREKRYNISYNSSTHCEGCAKKFPCFKRKAGKTSHVHRSYYIHCIEECEQYKSLGKIFTCAKCGLKSVRKAYHRCS